ncbi:MAG: GNAT family N-acetyltransferase [Solobacterium sp.]|nr:GNAT family N-acetyltransferase [Solobacterium sp.]
MKQYCDLHSTDTYWTAQRIISALDKFRVFLVVKDGKVLGYLDVQNCYDTNEIFALYIKPEASSRGYELSLLTKAIELNKPNQMMVVVDVDNKEEVELYTAAGFTKLEGQNSVTAYIKET